MSAHGLRFRPRPLRQHSFPDWLVGIAFAAIAIGALVPAAIMSIAAANLCTRNIHREFINRNPTGKQEAQMAKWVSLVVKLGALVFILERGQRASRGDRRDGDGGLLHLTGAASTDGPTVELRIRMCLFPDVVRSSLCCGGRGSTICGPYQP